MIQIKFADCSSFSSSDKNNTIICNELIYKIKNVLYGGMAKILICEQPYEVNTDRKTPLPDRIAIKGIKNTYQDSIGKLFEKELISWSKVKTKGIVDLLAIGKTDEDSLFAITNVYNGSLREIIRNRSHSIHDNLINNISVTDKVSLIYNLTNSLKEHFHKTDILHNDIKPENILFNTERVQSIDDRWENTFYNKFNFHISDWGIATIKERIIKNKQELNLSKEQTQDINGTVKYMAPERFVRECPLTEKSDIFSLGLIFYEILFKKHLFLKMEIEHASFIKEKVYSDKLEAILDKSFNENNLENYKSLKFTLADMLQYNTRYRISFERIQEQLSDYLLPRPSLIRKWCLGHKPGKRQTRLHLNEAGIKKLLCLYNAKGGINEDKAFISRGSLKYFQDIFNHESLGANLFGKSLLTVEEKFYAKIWGLIQYLDLAKQKAISHIVGENPFGINLSNRNDKLRQKFVIGDSEYFKAECIKIFSFIYNNNQDENCDIMQSTYEKLFEDNSTISHIWEKLEEWYKNSRILNLYYEMHALILNFAAANRFQQGITLSKSSLLKYSKCFIIRMRKVEWILSEKTVLFIKIKKLNEYSLLISRIDAIPELINREHKDHYKIIVYKKNKLIVQKNGRTDTRVYCKDYHYRGTFRHLSKEIFSQHLPEDRIGGLSK